MKVLSYFVLQCLFFGLLLSSSDESNGHPARSERIGHLPRPFIAFPPFQGFQYPWKYLNKLFPLNARRSCLHKLVQPLRIGCLDFGSLLELLASFAQLSSEFEDMVVYAS